MIDILTERRATVQRALGDTRLRLDTLEAQAAQAGRELEQLTGALLELNHLLGLVESPGGPAPDEHLTEEAPD